MPRLFLRALARKREREKETSKTRGGAFDGARSRQHANLNPTFSSTKNSLCCLCGASILPNPSNMCVTCIRSQVDITEGLSKSVSGFLLLKFFLEVFQSTSKRKKKLAAAARLQPPRPSLLLCHSRSASPPKTASTIKHFSSRSSGARPASATSSRRSTGPAPRPSRRSSSPSASAASRASARGLRRPAAATAPFGWSTRASSGRSRTRGA